MAVWLLLLFTPSEQTESLLGDLLEEFSLLVTKSGIDFARRWYWRQTLWTAQHATFNAFHTAPLLMLVAVVGGLWTIGHATTWFQHATQSFLDEQRMYQSHPSAYLFWSKFPSKVGRVLICAFIGSLLALLGKRREIQTVITLSVAQIAMLALAAVVVIARRDYWFDWFVAMSKWNALSAAATIAGGLAIKIGRLRTRKRPSPA